ncbi:MAG: 23S rRNA (adenine(2503)-C(2))-methyltransferase RlmN [Candidatus Caenarcaniphilales bacterium]|jgi:23S rRNA (adenine2503-C2)-methyltransferase|nr:23S rRNA (adenine(2503)-C(2))-methyltransferase RlmN [Candidatus Caenarcaniphilales bacterium]
MAERNKHQSLIGMRLEELETYIEELGLEKFRAKQIFKWIYSKNVRDIDNLSDISKDARLKLQADPKALPIGSLNLITHQISKDGTEKFLFETKSGEKVESVLMKFEERDSVSACISSQIGCAVGCPFCATGTLGFKKNLSAAEIIEQVLFMQNISGERIDNIVYMGQGEPLSNYDNVVESIRMLRELVGIGVRHITVSTSGIVPRIDQLAKENLQINLALSLHDPTDEGRDFLVPINKKWPVLEVINSLNRYELITNRRVTIEYVMLEGVNDSFEKAKILGELVRNLHCNINLIPYNQTDVSDPFKRSPNSNIKKFKELLEKTSRNKTVTIRRERGHDINAACGQLANKHQ